MHLGLSGGSESVGWAPSWNRDGDSSGRVVRLVGDGGEGGSPTIAQDPQPTSAPHQPHLFPPSRTNYKAKSQLPWAFGSLARAGKIATEHSFFNFNLLSSFDEFRSSSTTFHDESVGSWELGREMIG